MALLLFLCSFRTAAASSLPGRVLSIVGTNDLHGELAPLPWLAGHLRNLRAARERDGGAVVLLDAGDMLHGTLESSLDEGATVIRAYNALGYAAAAVGNHDFDFGQVGPTAGSRRKPGDPRGALKRRARQARFPFLLANVTHRDGSPLRWPRVVPSVLIAAGGIQVGIVGVTTPELERSTLRGHVRDLKVLPLAPVVVDEATRLRQRGATVVVVVAHAGAQCRHLGRPTDLRGCDRLAPAYRLAQALPAGLVDVIVAGDTHQAISHLVNGTAIIQSFSNGRAFGRVDVKLDGAGRRRGLHIWAPRLLCSGEESPGPGAGACRGFYEGGVVKADPALAADLAEIDERARAKREAPLNVVAAAPFYRVHGKEGPLGNLIADLFLVAVPRVDLAIVNSGGLRDDLPRGRLQYGDLFRILPFDNLFATVTLSAGQLEDVLARHLGRAGSLISVAGVRVRGRCRAGKVGVQILRDDGRPILPDEPLTVVTSDYLANGGDDFFDRPGQTAHLGPPIRQALAELLSQQGGTLRPGSHHDPRRPRLAFPGSRPVRCDRPRTRHR